MEMDTDIYYYYVKCMCKWIYASFELELYYFNKRSKKKPK